MSSAIECAAKLPRREPSDWLSPVIVKELRQGMRGRVFLISFLLIQVAMIYCAAGALLGATRTSSDDFLFFSSLFWTIIGIPLVFVIPMLGNQALQAEIKAQSLELVYLTRLTPWRIVAGKWAALFAQALLFVFAVLPYLVLRYFLGGVDLLSELIGLLWLLVACALLTAAAVGFSAHSTWLMRGAQTFFFLFLFMVGMNALMFGLRSGFFFPAATSGGIHPFLLAAVFVPLVLLLFLEIGTNKIAPPAGTRSFQFRVLGALFVLGAAVLEIAANGRGAASMIALPPVAIIVTLSLCETPLRIRSVYKPCSRRGWIGRLFGRFFLYPGWQSAVAYSIVVMGALMFLSANAFGGSADDWFPFLLLYTAILFPVAVTRLIRPVTHKGFAWFIGVNLAQVLLALLAYTLDQAGIEIGVLFSFMPTALALMLAWDLLPFMDSGPYNPVLLTVLVLSLAICFWRAVQVLRRIREMEQRPVAETSNETAAPAGNPA